MDAHHALMGAREQGGLRQRFSFLFGEGPHDIARSVNDAIDRDVGCEVST